MADLSPSAYVILGMLRVGAKSGYDIKRTVELSTRSFWNISHAQIYPSLAQLEQDGLVQGRSEPRGRQQRRVYELTDAGEAALRDWLLSDEPLTLELRDLGMLKLFFADALEPGEALELIASLRRRSEDGLRRLHGESERGAQRLADAGRRFPLLTLRLGLAFHESMIAACDAFERELTEAAAPRARRRTSLAS